MSKNKEIFAEPFYQDMKQWLIKNNILRSDVPIIKKLVEEYISKNLRPIDRQILFDDNLLTLGGHLTPDFLHWLVRLETWEFNKKK